MSRAWDKAKAGAKWLGSAGLAVGGVLGMLGGGALGALPEAPVGVAGGALIGLAAGAIRYGLAGVVIGGAAGGVYGAVSDEESQNVSLQKDAPGVSAQKNLDQAVSIQKEKEIESPQANTTHHQDRINQSRQQQMANHQDVTIS